MRRNLWIVDKKYVWLDVNISGGGYLIGGVQNLTLTAMFSLFYGLWKHVFSKTEFHVLILGVHKAGKTVILLEPVYCFSPLQFFAVHGCWD